MIRYGDVDESNTKIGDTVLYVQGPDRGHWGVRHTQCSLVKVIRFTSERVEIDWKTLVNPIHLFTLDAPEIVSIRVPGKKRNRIARIFIDSIRAQREVGVYEVVGFDVKKDAEVVIKRFHEKGRMKLAQNFVKELLERLKLN